MRLIPPTNPVPYRSAARSPIARFESAVAVACGKMYVIGGHLEPDLSATARTFAYDPKHDIWTRHADAPLEISHVTAAVVDDRYVWLVGGYEGQHPGKGVTASYRYDAVDDAWESGPPLPDARASGGLAQIGRQLHFFGGIGADRSTNFADHWTLDIDNAARWERRAPIPNPRTHAATAVHGDRIYAIGGHYGHDVPGHPGTLASTPDLDFVHRYEPAADAWEEVAPLPKRRSHCEPGTFVHDGKIICVGGRNNSPHAVSRYENITLKLQVQRALRKIGRLIKPITATGLDDVIGYDPAKDRWFDIGVLPQDLYAPAAAIIDGEIVVANGGRKAWRDPSDQTIRFKLSPANAGDP